MAGVFLVVVEDLAVDDGVVDSLCADDQPAAAAGQIVEHLGTPGGSYLVVIEKHNVGGKTRRKPAAIVHAEEGSGVRGNALDRAFEAEHLAVAHEGADEVRAVAGAAELVDVRTTVGDSEHRARVVEQLVRDIGAYGDVAKLQIVFEREVEENVEP